MRDSGRFAWCEVVITIFDPEDPYQGRQFEPGHFVRTSEWVACALYDESRPGESSESGRPRLIRFAGRMKRIAEHNNSAYGIRRVSFAGGETSHTAAHRFSTNKKSDLWGELSSARGNSVAVRTGEGFGSGGRPADSGLCARGHIGKLEAVNGDATLIEKPCHCLEKWARHGCARAVGHEQMEIAVESACRQHVGRAIHRSAGPARRSTALRLLFHKDQRLRKGVRRLQSETVEGVAFLPIPGIR